MDYHELSETMRIILAEHPTKTTWTVSGDHLLSLVNRVIEREREACAKVCEEVMQRYKTDTALDPNLNKVGAMSAELCALWIRKRGKK
jgi:hypothetical protein